MKIRKVLFVLVLCGLLSIAGSFMLTAHANEAPARAMTLSVFTQSTDLTEQTVTLTLQVNSTNQKKTSCLLYTVLRTADGQVDSACRHSASVNYGEQLVTLSHPFTSPSEQAELTVYCWNGNLQPLSDPLVLPIAFTQTVTSLTLSPAECSLILTTGQSVPLTAVHQPADLTCPALLYFTKDPQIATVSDTGLITPTGAGSTYIYALTADRSAYATCKVTVISDVTRITLSHNEVTLGSATVLSHQLTATVTPQDAPEKRLTYQSSHPSVATVDENGLIKAVARGQAVITATTLDGQASATCTVTVTEIVTEIKLNQSKVVMWDYGEYVLTANVIAEGQYTVEWSSSNDDIATVSSSGIVYGVAKGTAVITARVGSATATCTVSVHREYDYMGTVAAYFESRDNPASISGSGTGKSYGCFQLYAGSGGPQSFYNWLINTGFNAEIGTALKAAHAADGGGKTVYGTNFDNTWKQLAATQRDEFRSCQMAYCMNGYYQPLAERLATELGFFADNYGLALKSALWSRAIQHGTGGAFNRIRDAFAALGGFGGKTEKQLIEAIYKECGAVVTTPPSDRAIPMDSNSEIARENGLVGKYMKYYSANTSSVQAGVWKRLNITEPNMLYEIITNPPIVITK
ncbi:MAG: Ig-like domain-containing protein [Clostridia bacterium]|nr:Ig-like domain-containing protein [Clostridia bacterium]